MSAIEPGTTWTSDATDRPSLSAQAYAAIRDMLTTVRIPPGSPVNEEQLAKNLGMGRTPVREAIKRLETERLIAIYPRRGIFATPVALSDLTLLGEVREHLEGEAAYQAARRASTDQREKLRGLLAMGAERSAAMDAEIDFDSQVHRAIYAAAHNPYLESTLTQYYNLTIRIWHVWRDRLPDMSSHVSVLLPLMQCVIDGDGEGARRIARSHVSSFQDAIVQHP